MTTAAAILLLSSLSPATAERYAALIDREAERHQINPLLVVALIHRESRFNRRAVSGRNIGLGQVRVSATTHRKYLGLEAKLLAPKLNIRLTVRMLAYWRGYHRRHCRGGHLWNAHYQHGRRVKDRGSGDRVAATLARLQ